MSKHWQKGFTLVELMVAMAIGTIIILGAGQLFLTTFQTFRQVDELSRKQETVVFAASSIVRRIRGSEDGKSDYRLECEFEDPECLCTIYDDSDKGGSQPVLNFKKTLNEINSDSLENEQQCIASNKDDIGSRDNGEEGFLYEVKLPVEAGGKYIKFNVASRNEVLDQHGDNGDVADPSVTPDPDREGYYTDGTRIYNDECYKGNGDLHNKTDKHQGCNMP